MSESKVNTNKVIQALEKLKIVEWSFDGDDPTNETEFLTRFKKIIGVDKNGSSIITDDASKFGVTWEQVKAEMDKL